MIISRLTSLISCIYGVVVTSENGRDKAQHIATWRPGSKNFLNPGSVLVDNHPQDSSLNLPGEVASPIYILYTHL